MEDGNPEFTEINPGALLSCDGHGSTTRTLRIRVWPEFMRLDPIGGEALIATQNGRGSFQIHGGNLPADGRLHETYRCLRVDNDAAVQRAGLIRPQLQAGCQVLHKCQIV